MPSSSAKQSRFMAAIANNPSFAKKVGVSQSVGKDFNAADKGKTFKKGGMMKESKEMIGKEVAFMKKKGAPKSMIKHEKAEMGMKKFAEGGKMPMVEKDGKMVPSFAADGKGQMKMGGMAGMKKMMGGGMAKYAKGGGIEARGKTKGTMVRMATGGSVSSASRRADGIAQRGKTRC
jgi:hypothetical protein